MPVLQDILYKVKIRSFSGDMSTEIIDLQIDSRKVGPGTAFIAIRGAQADGHAFIEAAIEKKVSAIICETMPASLAEGIAYVQVENSSYAAGVTPMQRV
jgi:UDP-N-acetylmuramoyl-L-alanyl-D-glutamate--2,6-diaminopimelate ligase